MRVKEIADEIIEELLKMMVIRDLRDQKSSNQINALTVRKRKHQGMLCSTL